MKVIQTECSNLLQPKLVKVKQPAPKREPGKCGKPRSNPTLKTLAITAA
jgi:hypothetical protein